MKIGDRVFVHGYIDEIRKDTVIIRNEGGYFGTVPSEVVTGELPSSQPEWGKPVGDGRPLADSEIIPRLQDIKAQIGGSYAIDRAIEVLEVLPSAQPEQRWIPGSERLPEKSGKYLVTVLDGISKRTTTALYHPRQKSWTLTGRMAYWKVIAWMPLPEPYQEGEQDDEQRSD